jgi:hypothetical protein
MLAQAHAPAQATATSTIAEATNEEKLQSLISQNTRFANNSELLKQATAQGANLIAYYKNGVAGEGNDAVFDNNEMMKAIKILQDEGIVPSTPDATNLIAQNKTNNIQR